MTTHDGRPETREEFEERSSEIVSDIEDLAADTDDTEFESSSGEILIKVFLKMIEDSTGKLDITSEGKNAAINGFLDGLKQKAGVPA